MLIIDRPVQILPVGTVTQIVTRSKLITTQSCLHGNAINIQGLEKTAQALRELPYPPFDPAVHFQIIFRDPIGKR